MGDVKDWKIVKDVKGLGPSTLERLLKRIGGEENLIEALDSGDVRRLSSIDRISPSIAVRMILRYRGENGSSIVGNSGISDIKVRIVQMLKSRMHTDNSKNRVDLMIPGGDLRSKEVTARRFWELKELPVGRDRSEIERLLSGLNTTGRRDTGRKTFPYFLLAEDGEASQKIIEKGLDRYCMVGEPEDLELSGENSIIYVYNRRELDEEMIPFIHSVSMNSTPEEIIPDLAVERWSDKLGMIKNVAKLQEIFEQKGVAPEFAGILEELSSSAVDDLDPVSIEDEIMVMKSRAEEDMKEEISQLRVTGEDALSLLSEDRPGILKEIYGRIGGEINSRMMEKFGLSRDIFRIKYPLQVNREELESFIRDLREGQMQKRFEGKLQKSSRLVELEDGLKDDIDRAFELDFRYGLGSFILDLDLHPFHTSDGWFGIRGSSHMELREGGSYQPVTYHLGSVPSEHQDDFNGSREYDSRISLMTGANSGGKTTLLETISQVVIMAYMGLPVPADEAHVPDLKKLLLYKPTRRMDAGGLESFLKEILPLSLRADERTMVLADELEAMTELEAASRIISGFMEELREKNAYAVVVTHMAQGILEYLKVRTDGIEAMGLDENHRLMVDRTPIIGKHARSTPELILRSLEARSSGEEKDLYSSILEKFPRE